MTNDGDDLLQLRDLADYQFGAGVGEELFPPDGELFIERSRSGRPRQIVAESGRIASLTMLGRLTLGIEGGRRLHDRRSDDYRVGVTAESDPYVREGKNAFAKFVTRVDPQVRPGDEVCVETDGGALLGVGRAVLSAAAMRDFETGVAVTIRDGASEAAESEGSA